MVNFVSTFLDLCPEGANMYILSFEHVGLLEMVVERRDLRINLRVDHLWSCLLSSSFYWALGFFEGRATHLLHHRPDSESHLHCPPQLSRSTRESTFSYPLELSIHPSHHHRLVIIISLKRQNGILPPSFLCGTLLA